MPFINRYPQQDNDRNYFYTEEFSTIDKRFILAVGQTVGLPIITRIDMDGNVEWEKVYVLDRQRGPVVIRKIIQVDPDNTHRSDSTYVAHVVNSENEHFLMCIDDAGEQKWARKVLWHDPEVQLFLEPSRTDDTFYFVISNRYGKELPVAVKADSSGSVIRVYLLVIDRQELLITAVRSHKEGLALAGQFSDQSYKGVIIDLDADLRPMQGFQFEHPYLTLHDIEIPETGSYLVSGYLLDSRELFVTMIRDEGSTLLWAFQQTSEAQSKLALGRKDFYFLAYTDFTGLVYRVDWNFAVRWTKEIRLTVKEGNGIKDINFKIDSDMLAMDGYAPSAGSFIVHANADLDSCKTLEFDYPALWAYDCLVKRIDVSPKDIEVNLEEWMVGTDQFSIEKQEFCPPDNGDVPVEITDSTSLQSPSFYLQTAGSTGQESTAGIHARWSFAGALGSKHLPKGDYAGNTVNFNKPDDYVRLYRTPYLRTPVALELSRVPEVVDDNNKVWIHRLQGKVFYIYFRNQSRYSQVRQVVNPLQNPLEFIRQYGSEIIEIENKKELFFASDLGFTNITGASSLKVETLSVAENALAVPKVTTTRKTFTSGLNNVRLMSENGRSVRFRAFNCLPVVAYFEFYTDFILNVNRRGGWTPLGKFSLTKDTSLALNRLEPSSGLVHRKWQRYNDNAYVNIPNYHDRWNGPRQPWDRNISMVVDRYISLSNAAANPTALETVPMDSGSGSADDNMEVSNLDLLNVAAYDYHVARMLGLGHLDVSNVILTGQHVYIASYITKGDLEDGYGAREVHHLSMGLPTATTDYRLPLPVNLQSVLPGALWASETEDPVSLTAADGYSHDGKLRYVTLYSEELPEDQTNKAFFYSTREFDASTFTFPVYAGLEYRKVRNGGLDPGVWEKPELPNTPRYQNAVDLGQPVHNETISMPIPDPLDPLFVHKQDVSGLHHYSSYGINWFSRSARSNITLSIQTDLKPVNPLQPPSNIHALLVRNESPLLLTSQHEQSRLQAIPSGQDHTLIRLTFDYHSSHELLDYRVPVNSTLTDVQLETDPSTIYPDADELFADKIEIFFRNQVPNSVSGKAIAVTDHPSNTLLSIIQTANYNLVSVGELLIPNIPAGTESNYLGGVFIMGDQQYIIHSITLPSGSMQGPNFTVYKKEISDGIVTDAIPTPDADNLQSPEIVADGLFMAVENMQNAGSWGTPNPHSFKVDVGVGWGIHREVITVPDSDGQPERHLEKSRGIWRDATIEKVDEPRQLPNGTIIQEHQGLYRITFNGFTLPQHIQYNGSGLSVEWYQGIARVHTVLAPDGSRKLLKVEKIENIGTANALRIYASDPSFSSAAGYDQVLTGPSVSVNFYPGYKVYLYANTTYGLTEANILPSAGEGVHYSIFGLRSVDIDETDVNGDFYRSKISIPQLMFAQEIVEAIPPEMPQGSLYATRPDFFGRSTYTYKVKFAHKPHGVLCYRSNDEALLNALYEQTTVAEIRASLALLGGNNEAFLANRWNNFLDFAALQANGDFTAYPAGDPNIYKFPNPDKQAFFDWANGILQDLGQPLITDAPGTLPVGDPRIINFVRGAIYNAFVPLTEVPVIYQYIKGGSYQPLPKKQVIRNRDGHVLKPTDDEFDMAPMMKVTGGTGHEILFTDFNLDGTSNNLYFYGLRELNTVMKMSDFSPFLGPVKLVNTNPPEAPEIKRVMPVLKDFKMNTPAFVQLELNAYPIEQTVRKVNIYRAFNKLNAQSVRTMSLVRTVDLESEGIFTEPVWAVTDTFEDAEETPYGDGLFYRLTVSRKVEYADSNGNIVTEYAPSQPSKLVATVIVEASNPPAPVLGYVSEPLDAQQEFHSVMLRWEKTTYNGRYLVYKMMPTGNWLKIHELTSNAPVIYLPLENTSLASSTLAIEDADGNPVYHKFKVVAENSAGMQSVDENILVIPDGSSWQDIGGIDDMIIGSTFIVRP
jgi:hypothetical protein